MPRPRRAAEGDLIYHALNRANARLALFDDEDDYAAFERVLQQAVARFDMRLLSYCLMPDHFQLLLWPREDGDLSTFMRWLTMTHTQRLARPARDGRHRAPVSRPVQVVPGPGGRAFSHSVPLRRTERAAGGLGRARGGVEMGEPLGSSDQGRGGATDFDALADQTPARLDGAGEPAVPPDGGGGDTPQHTSRSTVRFGVVAVRGSGEAGSGVVAPAQRPTTKTTEQRLLSPLFPL